jgi:hypothetical protein
MGAQRATVAAPVVERIGHTLAGGVVKAVALLQRNELIRKIRRKRERHAIAPAPA